MTDTLCTIASSSYMKYADKMIETAKKTGFKGHVEAIEPRNYRFTPDTRFDDSRWMQFELDSFFTYNDRVLYMDADCVFHKSFPWKTIFDNEFACSIMPDWIDEQMVINKITGHQEDRKFIGTPFVFRKTKGTDRFFRLCRALIHAAAFYGRGSMVPFNAACYFQNQPRNVIDRKYILYPKDIDAGESTAGKWITHFAGGRGKKLWEREYGL